MALSWLWADPDGVRLTVRVQPRAGQTRITGVLDDALKIRLAAAPVDGGANEAFLTKRLRRPKSSIQILLGQHSRLKSLWVEGLAEKAVQSALGDIE